VQFDRSFEVEETKLRIEESGKSFQMVVDAGIKICAGVDALGRLFEEIELFVEGGLSPLQALTAATKTNAEVLGADDRLGTIETGKYADLLVVDGNPAERITDLRNIDITMKGGVAYRPAEWMKAIPPGLWYEAPRTKEAGTVLAARQRDANKPLTLGQLVGMA
jgi:imidazolonepropionase-like amidohydrolase